MSVCGVVYEERTRKAVELKACGLHGKASKEGMCDEHAKQVRLIRSIPSLLAAYNRQVERYNAETGKEVPLLSSS